MALVRGTRRRQGADGNQVAAAGVDAVADVVSAGLEAGAVDEAEESPLEEPSAAPLGFLPPSRKSVTYQPEPLSWKPAAVTCLT